MYRKISSEEQRRSSDDDYLSNIDDLEDIIGDEAFASFLNSDAEIQVGNEIYKYTDVGLFITTDYSKLNTYLEVKNISKDLLVRTDETSAREYLNSSPDGYSEIDDGLNYFRNAVIDVPILYDPSNDGGSGSGSGSGNGSNSSSTYESYIANLAPCDHKSGVFGDGIFGVNRICIDKYESDQRVKTKAFNYDYLLAYHIGVKIKHQKKGWTGVWRQQDTEEIGMLLDAAMFRYDSSPVVNTALSNLNLKTTFISPNQISPAYHKGYYKVNVTDWGSPTVPTNFITVNFTHTLYYPYPFEIFHDDLVIECWNNNSIIDMAVQQGNKNLVKEKLNKYAWDYIYKQSVNYLKAVATGSNYTMPNNATIISKHKVGSVWIHKTSKKFKINDSKVEKTFDWGAGIKLTLNESNNYNIMNSTIGPQEQSQKPKDLGVRLFGLAKRNGKWHGSLMEF